MEQYQKMIVPYLDGSLSVADRAEFEAFVMTHPEFESQIRVKSEELNFLKGLIPAAIIGKETEISLENEIRDSIFHLLRKEPTSLWERIKYGWEDIVSR